VSRAVPKDIPARIARKKRDKYALIERPPCDTLAMKTSEISVN